MSGAQPVRVAARQRFDVAEWVVDVLQAEGAVQLLLVAPGVPSERATASRGVTIGNAFAGPGTAAQLRAIADHLEGLEWTE